MWHYFGNLCDVTHMLIHRHPCLRKSTGGVSALAGVRRSVTLELRSRDVLRPLATWLFSGALTPLETFISVVGSEVRQRTCNGCMLIDNLVCGIKVFFSVNR